MLKTKFLIQTESIQNVWYPCFFQFSDSHTDPLWNASLPFANVVILQTTSTQLNRIQCWQKDSLRPYPSQFSLQLDIPFFLGSLDSTWKLQVPLKSVPSCVKPTCVKFNPLSSSLFRLFQFIYFLTFNLYSAYCLLFIELTLFGSYIEFMILKY